MTEVVNVVVALAVIVFIVRWATSGSGDSAASNDPNAAAARALGFRPKKVTPEMVDTIAGMFPDIPRDNIRYELLRNGSVERTSNKILEKGYLDPPPECYYRAYPREPAVQANNNAPTGATTATQQRTTATKAKDTLISRYNLQSRLSSETSDTVTVTEQEVGGKAKWEDSPEKREANLKERKAQMILAARQRMLAQQQQKEKEGQASSSS